MTIFVIARTIRQGNASAAFPGEVVVTPRTLDRLRGRVADGVAFTPSAFDLNETERANVAEAIAIAAETSMWGDRVLNRLNRWTAKEFDPQSVDSGSAD